MSGLVLSLFPGARFFDRAFELEGFCVVAGPDVLFGGDVRDFHPPTGRFDGIIGGPPCQSFSPIGNVNRARYGDDSVMPDLIPEFYRVLNEAAPNWYVMENSPHAHGRDFKYTLDNAWLGERQARRRCFWSNLELSIEVPCFGHPNPERTVTSKQSVDWRGSRAKEPTRTLEDMLDLQGYPRDYFGEHSPFTMQARRKMVGNGVAMPTGRAIARAVKRALESTGGERAAPRGHAHYIPPPNWPL